MADAHDLLIEIGTEELPPKDLKRLSDAFTREILSGLEAMGLAFGNARSFATPRRLAILIAEVQSSQPERQSERRGPAVNVAFDADGNPTKAAMGFARSCGVEVEHLERLETDKGEWLVFRTTEVAQFTTSLVAGIVETALAKLPISRRMRWGSSEAEFVRPVHWAVLLFGDAVIEADILDIESGPTTYGHRFMSPDPIVLRHANEYENRLLRDGRVIADFATRRDKIEQQIIEAAENIGGVATIDPSLLDEVTSMVEWPVAVTGSFDEEFLELPEQVLIATMQGHQRYFPIADPYGALAPRFITVSNIESTNPDAVRAGNERVIRPRLKDAAFFFDNDLRTPMDDWVGQLESMVFQDKLGSLADKARRVSELARHVAVAMGAGPDVVRAAVRAGVLSKSDLVTEMVGEFPELQGTIGAAYARRQGEDEQVANAMAEVYRPRFAGDAIPGTPGGMALAVADKLDTLVGIFGIGLAPSGDRDPYALRRAALGALRIIIEGKLDVSLGKLVQAAIDGYGATFGPDLPDGSSVAELVTGFMEDRLRAYFTEQGISVDVFLAVQAKQPQRPLDFAARVLAVNAFRALPEAASLTAANKRIQNILRQADLEIPANVDDALLSEDAEWNLAAKLVGLGPSVSEHLRSSNYEAALSQLAGMQEAIDGFFDAVKVMDDDVKVRANRLALLNTVGQLFMETADISQLQG